MKITVRLTYLDRQPALHYSTGDLPVIVNHNFNNPVGGLKIFTNDQGLHFALIDSDQALDMELFFYYRGLHEDDGYFHFTGLQLMAEPLTGKPTIKLKDMIVLQ